MDKKILYVSHKKAQCGIYVFGKSITDVLQQSKRYQFVRVECSSLNEFHEAISEYTPAGIIYNYSPVVLPWVVTHVASKLYKNNIASITIPQIGIIHEITQQVADSAVNYKNNFFVSGAYRLSNSLFDYYITPDPTLLLRNPIVYKTGRLIPPYQNNFPIPSKPVIGSFGFGTPKKGFENIVKLVQDEFDEATIRFNIPAADFGCDKQGVHAREIAQRCKSFITKPGIRLIVTHEFMDDKGMLDFLAQNTVNVFLYEHDAMSGKGLSSAVDNAMAVQRPVAISNGVMFKHLFDVTPSICVTKNSLKTIIQNGFAPLQKHFDEWNAENLIWEYERILDSIFKKFQNPPKLETCINKTLQSKWRGLLLKPDKNFTWLRNTEHAADDDLLVDSSVKYQPIQIPEGVSLNRILDDNARELYKPAIDVITSFVPKTMAKKIARANVQQGFVFDTVYRYISRYKNPKLLCVGCYEDTASMSLKKMGYEVEEIDPMLNYYLQEFITKPTTVKHSYDIIFSTSVIEHDPDDVSFIKSISDLLAPGSVAVLTCDYKDGWKQGESKPDVDARLYTQHDLRERLLPLMTNCHLVDKPQWDCPKPDFNYMGKYQYTFATFVVGRDTRN
jgi:hypothetical protein